MEGLGGIRGVGELQNYPDANSANRRGVYHMTLSNCLAEKDEKGIDRPGCAASDARRKVN
jgi:hypothetical protein